MNLFPLTFSSTTRRRHLQLVLELVDGDDHDYEYDEHDDEHDYQHDDQHDDEHDYQTSTPSLLFSPGPLFAHLLVAPVFSCASEFEKGPCVGTCYC